MVRAVTTERIPVPNDRVHHDRSAIGRRRTAQRPPGHTPVPAGDSVHQGQPVGQLGVEIGW